MKFIINLTKLPIIGNIFVKVLFHICKQYDSRLLREYVDKNFNVCVGMYSYGGCFSSDFNLGGKVIIGRYCSLASNIHYFGANHPLNTISTSPYFYNKSFGYVDDDIERFVLKIENDVWIGSGVIITCGCHSIGNGAVIGAGSVVTKDVPAYAIVAGNPAKVIRYRFNEREREIINNSNWFCKNPNQLIYLFPYRKSPVDFVKKLNELK